MADPSVDELELGDIQGLVLYGYGHLHHLGILLLRIEDRQRACGWLLSLAERVLSAEAARERDDAADYSLRLSMGFTVAGIGALGCEEAIGTFPVEFQHTMPHRSRILDGVEVDPAQLPWEIHEGRDRTHVGVLVHARTAEAREEALRDLETAALASGLALAPGVQRGDRDRETKREHFGFRDGISDPLILELGHEATAHARPVRAGEFVLGYENEYARISSGPTIDPHFDPGGLLGRLEQRGRAPRADLGRNGTFLVYRKLAQDVAGFWKGLQDQAARLGVDSEWLAAKLLGRWPNGAPVREGQEAQPPDPPDDELDALGYRDDARGLSCPIGSHVRRANPRDGLSGHTPEESFKRSNRHRLIRRGFPYGPPVADRLAPLAEGEERGLHFLAFNANIRRQFEFVQQTWLNSPVFDSLHQNPDPLVGPPSSGSSWLKIPRTPVRLRIPLLTSYVEVRGGAYFFFPGLKALRVLCGARASVDA